MWQEVRAERPNGVQTLTFVGLADLLQRKLQQAKAVSERLSSGLPPPEPSAAAAPLPKVLRLMPEELDGLDLWDLRPDDYMEVGGTWYRVQASLGVQWNVVPARPSAGREFFNSYLAELLTKDATQILSREQLIALGLSDLTDEHFIAVTSEGSTLYFKPDYEDDTDELAVDYHELCKILSRAPERVLALAR